MVVLQLVFSAFTLRSCTTEYAKLNGSAARVAGLLSELKGLEGHFRRAVVPYGPCDVINAAAKNVARLLAPGGDYFIINSQFTSDSV